MLPVGTSLPSGMFSGMSDGSTANAQQYRSYMAASGSEGDLSSAVTPQILGIGMGKGMGMGKGGKGSISSMGFSHPSHRLALLSGQVHQILPPNKIAQKIRSNKEEEGILLANAVGAREVADEEAESSRQMQLQISDREQQTALLAAQTAASAVRSVRQRPLYTSQGNQGQGQGQGQYPVAYPTGATGGVSTLGSLSVPDRSPRAGPGCSPGNPTQQQNQNQNSPSTMSNLHLPSGLSRQPNQLSQLNGPGPMQSSTGYSMYNNNNNNNNYPEKEGYIKPITGTAVLTASMNGVRSLLHFSFFVFFFQQNFSLAWSIAASHLLCK